MYDTYRFKDKDPVIDIARTCIEIYATVNQMTFPVALKRISKSSGVATDTMYRWFRGSTVSPRFCTVVAVVHATGRSVIVNENDLSSKPRFRKAA